MVVAIARMYLSSIAALISSAAVLKSSIDAGLTLQTWSFLPSPQEKVAEDAIRQSPRNHSPNNFFLEQVQDGLGTVSSCAILLADIDLTGDR